MRGEIFATAMSVVLLSITAAAIRRQLLTGMLAVLWLVISTATFLLSITLPFNLLSALSRLFGIAYAPNLVLVFAIFILILFTFNLSMATSRQSFRIRSLTQDLALLQERVREIGIDTRAPVIAQAQDAD